MARVSDALAPSKTPPPVPSQIMPQKAKMFFAEIAICVLGSVALYLLNRTETKIEMPRTIIAVRENENNEIPANTTDKTARPSITYHMTLVSVLFIS